MFEDVITLFTHLSEDAEGQAQYGRTVLRRALVRASDGAKQYPARNLESEDRATVYFRTGERGSGPRFVPEGVFDGLEDRRGVFTVRSDGRDRVFFGETECDAPPPGARTYRPVSVAVNEKGSRRMWHVKVVCR